MKPRVDENGTTETCITCRFYDCIRGCMRHAPTAIQTEFGPESRFPAVNSFEWCGDYEKET